MYTSLETIARNYAAKAKSLYKDGYGENAQNYRDYDKMVQELLGKENYNAMMEKVEELGLW